MPVNSGELIISASYEVIFSIQLIEQYQAKFVRSIKDCNLLYCFRSFNPLECNLIKTATSTTSYCIFDYVFRRHYMLIPCTVFQWNRSSGASSTHSFWLNPVCVWWQNFMVNFCEFLRKVISEGHICAHRRGSIQSMQSTKA